jgi:chromosome segregation ATPase
MSFLAETQSSIIVEFEKTQREYEQLTRDRDAKLDLLATKKSQIDEIKTEWLSSLNHLIEKVNTNFGGFFASMKCAGEVSLRKEDEVKYYN